MDALARDGYACEVDRPASAGGEWWIDVSLDGVRSSVAWTDAHGFGLYLGDEDAYGERPDEIHGDPLAAAERLRAIMAGEAMLPKP